MKQILSIFAAGEEQKRKKTMTTSKTTTSKTARNATDRRMTKDEYMATLPPKISKAGQWMLDHWDDAKYYTVDWKAVMKRDIFLIQTS